MVFLYAANLNNLIVFFAITDIFHIKINTLKQNELFLQKLNQRCTNIFEFHFRCVVFFTGLLSTTPTLHIEPHSLDSHGFFVHLPELFPISAVPCCLILPK